MDYVIVSFSFMHENVIIYSPEEIVDTYKGLNSYKDSLITYHSLLIVLSVVNCSSWTPSKSHSSLAQCYSTGGNRSILR